MIYLKLFLTFFQIGAVSFGGGYGMISLIRERMLALGWLTEEELLNMIAVAESTPGPIAINISTFVGSSQGGILGSFLATLGVVLPSFIIILIISAFITNLLKFKGVNAFLNGVRPCVVGLIMGTAITMLLSKLINLATYQSEIKFDVPGAIILAIILIIAFTIKKITKKKASPIIMILISALLGMIFYPMF